MSSTNQPLTGTSLPRYLPLQFTALRSPRPPFVLSPSYKPIVLLFQRCSRPSSNPFQLLVTANSRVDAPRRTCLCVFLLLSGSCQVLCRAPRSAPKEARERDPFPSLREERPGVGTGARRGGGSIPSGGSGALSPGCKRQ